MEQKHVPQTTIMPYFNDVTHCDNLQIAQGMAREATRLLKRRFPDVPLNVEPVQEPRDKAFGNGTGIV